MPRKPSLEEVSHQDILRLVGESLVCEQSIKNYLAGKPVMHATRARIEQAATRLGIELPKIEHPPVVKKPRVVTT